MYSYYSLKQKTYKLNSVPIKVHHTLVKIQMKLEIHNFKYTYML